MTHGISNMQDLRHCGDCCWPATFRPKLGLALVVELVVRNTTRRKSCVELTRTNYQIVAVPCICAVSHWHLHVVIAPNAATCHHISYWRKTWSPKKTCLHMPDDSASLREGSLEKKKGCDNRSPQEINYRISQAQIWAAKKEFPTLSNSLTAGLASSSLCFCKAAKHFMRFPFALKADIRLET